MVKTEEMVSSLPHEKRPLRLEVNDVTISYSGQTALAGVNLQIHENEIFGIIGPANSGKTSFLKALNRMDMFNPAMQVDGRIRFNAWNVLPCGMR
jgi:phosphate transport system ATP-binding protein